MLTRGCRIVIVKGRYGYLCHCRVLFVAAAAIAAECIFSEAASDIVIGERCSRVARNYSFYPHVAHCGVGIWRDNRVAMDCSKCSSCMKRHRDLFL